MTAISFGRICKKIGAYVLPGVILGLLILLCSASFSLAASGGTNPPTGGNSGGCTSQALCNPLQAKTVQEFLMNIIDIILVFALPVIVFFIIYAGYLFVTARGDTGQISDAKHALTWAIIGGVIVLGARAIIAVVQGTVESL